MTNTTRLTHGTDKLPGMVKFPIGEQKGDTIRRASREQCRLEPAHRHGHGHSPAKVHPIAAAFDVDDTIAIVSFRRHGYIRF
jgi:hypothetical protein